MILAICSNIGEKRTTQHAMGSVKREAEQRGEKERMERVGKVKTRDCFAKALDTSAPLINHAHAREGLSPILSINIVINFQFNLYHYYWEFSGGVQLLRECLY